jgi:hypothetical protein
MTFVPNSGPINTSMINAAFGLGEDINLYKGVRWYYPGNLTTGLFSTSTIKMSDFFGKQGTDPATLGTYFANAAGSGSFTIPLYRNYLKIEIWGAGGSGGGGNGTAGSKGGDSTVLGVTAGGGQGGNAGNIPVPAPVNIGGSPSGGGHDPINSPGYYSGYGGYGDNGGGNNVQGSGPGGTIQDCLVPWAKIAMEDGTTKEVQNIKIGDKVKSMSGTINKVIAISNPTIDTNLVEFNGLESFITETHPLLTDKGWGTFNLELLKLCQQHEYQKIVEDNNGNELIQIDETVNLATKVTDKIEFVNVKNIKFKEVKDFVVYRISVDGDNTYISENFVSHNKPV